MYVYMHAYDTHTYLFFLLKLRLSALAGITQLAGGRAGVPMQPGHQGRPALGILCHLPLEALCHWFTGRSLAFIYGPAGACGQGSWGHRVGRRALSGYSMGRLINKV